jgi:predicted Rossmann fold flavoprotein
MEHADLIIIGAGAAGLAAAIFAGEELAAQGSNHRVAILEGAVKPGAKILISGGGRCNVTNERVLPDDYQGGPRPLIRNVLRAFDERATLTWFGRMGVPLKLEPTGKYFPLSNDAHTVLDALLRRAAELGVRLHTGQRVESLDALPEPSNTGAAFQIQTRSAADSASQWQCRRLIVAIGGMALPKSGSDGAGYAWLTRLGHTLVPVTPALVPLLLAKSASPAGRLTELSGLTLLARLRILDAAGRRCAEVTGSTLLTHFGLSGPGPLDISRHWLRLRLENPGGGYQLCLGHPALATPEAADAWLRAEAERRPGALPAMALTQLFPERLAQLLAGGLPPFRQLTRADRLELARRLVQMPLPVAGDRGHSFAEVTAGGIDLREIDARTMESRCVPRLHLCGEVLDVDGRIGGFNFQWAWASGYLAGRAAARGLL